MVRKLPEWLKVSYNKDAVNEVNEIMADLKLNTVCKEANCPNLGECFKKHTATFMILGSICTRHCRFCNVTHGHAEKVDPHEPVHLAEAVKKMD
ncbi:MAG TPA: lipoyl synthase, partial [Clostridiales bacterium]|nr:lipoyl synthase [Clostridiales bacterium]